MTISRRRRRRRRRTIMTRMMMVMAVVMMVEVVVIMVRSCRDWSLKAANCGTYCLQIRTTPTWCT